MPGNSRLFRKRNTPVEQSSLIAAPADTPNSLIRMFSISIADRFGIKPCNP
jgi:hypothetical protein